MTDRKDEIRDAVEAFLADWNRGDWMAEHGEWASEDDDSISPEADYIEEGTIDPDGVEGECESLGVGYSGRGWDCIEGWRAHRAGDRLVLNWYRTETCGARRERDLWVIVDERFFADEEAIKAAREKLAEAGYDVSGASDETRIILSVSDPGDDDAASEQALEALRDIVGSDYSVEWTGDGNTDADGYSTADVSISVY